MPGSPSGRSDSGGTCPLLEGSLPNLQGNLFTQRGCLTCSPVPQPEGFPDYGSQDPPVDDGHGDGNVATHELGLVGVTSISGSSPLTLDYQVDTTAVIPRTGRILCARATYTCQPSGPPPAPPVTFQDDGGGPITANISVVIEWNKDEVDALNFTPRPGQLPVHATATWSGGFGGFFEVNKVEITQTL
jgi:hypothetical protein